MSFFLAGVPVLHAFTGAHADYHKPSDTPDHVDAAGAAQVAALVADLARDVSAREARLVLTRHEGGPPSRGDARSFGASLGTIPDYAGPPNGEKGVLLAGVRPGGGADKGGLKKGDLLVRIGSRALGSVEDLMYALGAHKPGETVKAVVKRDGREVVLDVTFQDAHAPRLRRGAPSRAGRGQGVPPAGFPHSPAYA
jgi:S1-C subfamily serine protease